MTDSDEHPTRQPTLVTLMFRAAQAMVRELVARISAAGYTDIRPVDSRVFENLDPGGTRLTVLAARAQMTHQSMAELVASLEERGYLERRPDPADRRARLVEFTPRGRDMMRIALTMLAEIESCWLRHLDLGPDANLRAALARTLGGEAGMAIGPVQSEASCPERKSRTRPVTKYR